MRKWSSTRRWNSQTHRVDAVAGSHHSWGAAHSSEHKRTKRACCTQEIAAMQFTTVKQRWRTQSLSHTHGHTHAYLHSYTQTHTLVVCLHGSVNGSMRALFTKVNSPSDSPQRFVCEFGLVCTYHVFVRVLFIFCVGPAEGWELFCMWLNLTNELFSTSLKPEEHSEQTGPSLLVNLRRAHLDLKPSVVLCAEHSV